MDLPVILKWDFIGSRMIYVQVLELPAEGGDFPGFLVTKLLIA